MKTFKKALPILGVLFWALLLAPFFFGAQAAHPAKPQPPQLAPGRVLWISSIRASFFTAKILEAKARTPPKAPPSTPRVSTA